MNMVLKEKINTYYIYVNFQKKYTSIIFNIFNYKNNIIH